ncbi:unnamed protein product [Ixodes hexagonus]
MWFLPADGDRRRVRLLPRVAGRRTEAAGLRNVPPGLRGLVPQPWGVEVGLPQHAALRAARDGRKCQRIPDTLRPVDDHLDMFLLVPTTLAPLALQICSLQAVCPVAVEPPAKEK